MKTDRLHSVRATALFLLAVLFSMMTNAQDFAGGTGSLLDPYQVATATHLNNVRYYPTSHFIQTANIDLNVSPYNTGDGWVPIGSSASKFLGSYNGQQYSISNLYINQPSADYIGLFGFLEGFAELINIGLNDVNIKGRSYVGAVAGRSEGTISQCYSSGIVSATSWVGGIAGYVYGPGASNVGLVINCYSLAYVEATASTKNAGGITGYLYYGTLTNCYASGGISAGSGTGGIVGNSSTPVINNCFWNSETSGQLSSHGGGSALSISQMRSASTFTAAGWDFTNIWTISEGTSYPRLLANPQTPWPNPRPFMVSTIQQLDNIRNFRHGHFLQANHLDFNDDDSYSKEEGWEAFKASMTTGTGFNPIGNASTASFNGLFDGSIYAIRNLYINRPSTDYIGLFSFIEGAGEVRNTGIEGANITGKNYAGAIAGRSDGTISQSYSSGIISATSNTGGIAGYIYNSGASTVGLAINCYSLAYIEATASTNAGGIVGYLYYGTLTNCYASGGISTGTNSGGIIGYGNNALVNNCFWNSETSGQLSSHSGGIAISISQMRSASTFTAAGWDFTNIWAISEGTSYPRLLANPQTPWPNPRPFMISTIQQLDNIRNLKHGHFLQANHLDFNDDDSYSKEEGWEAFKASMTTGTGFNPIGNTSTASFNGLFDGSIYAIRNLHINRPSTDYIGLFGYLEGAGEVRNTGIEGANVTGKNYVGAIAGRSNGTISRSYSNGTISATSYTGGIAGYISGSGTVNIGLAINCYSQSDVGASASSKNAGGIVGYLHTGTLTNCYASGGVSAGTATGGIVGSITTSVINNCFWNIETTGQLSSPGGGQGITTWEMMTKSTFLNVGWDFTHTWDIIENESYPWLKANPQVPPPAPIPIEIFTIQDLNNARSLLFGHYKLMNHLDFNNNDSYSKEAGWESFKLQMTTGSGFEPIGNNTTPFTGLFDGNGFSIHNLFINRPGTSFIGLFGKFNSAGSISKLGLQNVNINGSNYVGGITGRNEGTIAECFVTGHINGISYVGGITGYNYGSGSSPGLVADSYNLAEVQASASASNVGGIAGYNQSAKIKRCYSGGMIKGFSNSGGLSGYASTAEVIGSFWNIETSGQLSSAGGGAGVETWKMMTSYYFINAGWDFATIWGIDKYESYPWLKRNKQIPVPPLPVEIYTIQDLNNVKNKLNAYYKLMGNVDFNDNSSYSQEEGWEAFKTAMTSGNGFEPIGNSTSPFTGFFDGNGYTISNLFINRPGTDYVGLFGNIDNLGSVKNLGVINANVTGKDFVGVIAGQSRATIAACYSSGSANGTNETGGIAGRLDGYSTSNVSLLINSYSFAAATSTVNRAGGLAGFIRYAEIRNCYAAGPVSAPSNSGGLAGASNVSSVYSSYWNTQTTGQAISAGGGAGRTTLEMTYPYDPNTYTPWNFVNIWAADVNSDVNSGYPYLGFTGSHYATNLILSDGVSDCYDLEQVITIAGDYTGVILESGSSLEVTAINRVHILDGTIIKQGAYFKAWISDQAYCNNEKSLLAVESNDAIKPEIHDDLGNSEIAFRIFPNPTTGLFTLEHDEFGEFSTVTVEIISMVGENIIRQELPTAARYQVDLSRYQPGIYLVRVIHGPEAVVLKVVKK